MSILFVSDIHLHIEHPSTIAAFLAFLAGPARQAESLYILGDLFDLWVGDDAYQLEEQPILEALRALSESGIAIFVMHGNHDFFYGARFANGIGGLLLADPCVIDLYGTPTLLTHGDLLCTNDISYQQFRKMVRNPVWQMEQLTKTVDARITLAKELRMQSRIYTAIKTPDLMDVNQSEVELLLRAHNVRHLIHGHTHRPAHHDFLLDGQPARRTVLPNWYAKPALPARNQVIGGYLECTEQACNLLSIINRHYRKPIVLLDIN